VKYPPRPDAAANRFPGNGPRRFKAQKEKAMSTSTLDAIRESQRQQAEAHAAAYRAIVAATALDEPIDQASAATTLQRAGKSLDDLEADVETFHARRADAAIACHRPEAAAASQAAGQRRRQAQERLDNLVRDIDAAKQELQLADAASTAASRRLKDIGDAERRLSATSPDTAARARLKATKEYLLGLNKQRSDLQAELEALPGQEAKAAADVARLAGSLRGLGEAADSPSSRQLRREIEAAERRVATVRASIAKARDQQAALPALIRDAEQAIAELQATLRQA
jgi:chromosome segregation ATPase